ncbi:hypothetical protein D3C85_1363120 [compost metagenome]
MEYVPIVLFVVFLGIVLWTGVIRYDRLQMSLEQRTTLLTAAVICVFAGVAQLLMLIQMPVLIGLIVMIVLVPIMGAVYRTVRRRTEERY